MVLWFTLYGSLYTVFLSRFTFVISMLKIGDYCREPGMQFVKYYNLHCEYFSNFRPSVIFSQSFKLILIS
jgi:hypothetical protein